MARRKNTRMMYKIGFFFMILTLFSCNKSEENEEQQPKSITFTDLLNLVTDVSAIERKEMVSSFMDSVDEVPLIIHNDTAIFLYQGTARSIQVAGDFNGWDPSGSDFKSIEDTDIWYKELVFESNARLDYKLVIDGANWVLDPLNPNKIAGGFGSNSELAMPDYIQPWEINRDENLPKGSLESKSIVSASINKNYQLRVYLPPNYTSSQKYPVVYFQDGLEYINLASTTIVLDNLIDKDLIEPVMGVFVIPNERNSEYAFADRFRYRNFFVDELVPYIDSTYSTHPRASKRAVIGDSYGGNISAIIAFTRPDVFGNCGIHSGAFQSNNFDTNSLVMDEKLKQIKVASIWGSYEGASLPRNMHRIKDYLVDTGYDVHWNEYPEGHSWGLWRATIDEMLIHFFPTK